MKKTKKEIQLIPIEFPMFDGSVNYFVEPDRKKVSRFIKEKYDRNYECTGSGLTICDKGKDPVVWFHDTRAHVVAHEMIHAVKHFFGLLGHEDITGDNDELFAYMVDYCVKKVLNIK